MNRFVTFAFLLAVGALWKPSSAEIVKSGEEAVGVFKCPQMNYFTNPNLDVQVSQDSKTGEYIYEYSLTPDPSDKQRVHLLSVKGIAESKVISGFTGWALCGYRQKTPNIGPDVICINDLRGEPEGGVFSGLVLRSKSTPGLIRYQVEGASDRGILSKEDVAALLPYYRNSASALSEDLQAQIGEQCPSGRVRKDAEREMTGVVIGPSEISSEGIEAMDIQIKSLRGVTFHLRADSTRLAGVDRASLKISDSLGRSLVHEAGPGGTRRSTDDALAVVADFPGGIVPCNVRGVIVQGKLSDGRLFRTGGPVATPKCVDRDPPTFKFALPTLQK